MTNKDTEICNCYPGGPIRLPKGIHPEHRTGAVVTGTDANPNDDHGKDDHETQATGPSYPNQGPGRPAPGFSDHDQLSEETFGLPESLSIRNSSLGQSE